ncbi:MAG: hypothetical protein WCZ86_06170 [Desulfurivibrionaceae bacterium]
MSENQSPKEQITSVAQLQPGDQLKFGQWHTVTRVVEETGIIDLKPEQGRATQFSFEQAEQLLKAGAARRPSWELLELVSSKPTVRTAVFNEVPVKGNDPAADDKGAEA